MNKSEQIEMLASALSKFQGEIQNVFKGKKGYGYNYADLASILEDVRPILSKYGLSLVQLAGNSGDNVSIETVIMHESGQYISESILMPVDVGKGMTRAQAIGSVISYARRYALTSALCIAQTDTDASQSLEEEIKPKVINRPDVTRPQKSKMEEEIKPKYNPKPFIDKRNIKDYIEHVDENGVITKLASSPLFKLRALIHRLSVQDEEVSRWCKKGHVQLLEDMPDTQVGMLISMLEARESISKEGDHYVE